MNREEILEWIVVRMRAAFDVQRVILFGSQARGDATPDSDYDVLVEVECDLPFHERQVAGLVALARRPFSIDLMVLTADEIRRQSELLGSAVDWALLEGQTLYARA